MPRVKRKSRIGTIRKHYWVKKSIPDVKLSENCECEELLNRKLDDFFIINDGAVSTLDSENHENRHIENLDSDGFKADEFIVILDKPYKYSADANLDEFVEEKWSCVFSKLREDCKNQIQVYGQFTYMGQCKDIKFIQLYDSDAHCHTLRIKSCVTIGQDLRISVHVHDRPLPDNHMLWNSIGHVCYTVKSVKLVLNKISKYAICKGNQDSELQDLVPVGTYTDFSESQNGYQYQGYRESCFIGPTIRSTQCDSLIDSRSNRCKHCSTYRRTLRKALTRRLNSPKVATSLNDWTKSRVSNNKLTESEKIHKIKQLRECCSNLELENQRLKRKINNKIIKDGVKSKETEEKDKTDCIENSEHEIVTNIPEENNQRLFWMQQKKCAELQNSHGMRWHPSIIKWCMDFKEKSPKAYDILRNSGFVKLPSERRLFDYRNDTKRGTGFQIEKLMDESEKSINESPTVERQDIAPFHNNKKRRLDLSDVENIPL